MAYTDHFASGDRLIAHLDVVVPTITDPLLRAQYVGFLTVSVVTVFELCVKDVLTEFATRKHKTFGTYCSNAFERLNGRVNLRDLREQHIKRFGDKYVGRFNSKITALENEFLRRDRISVSSSYGNVIVWRNSFAHEGRLPPNASYEETTKGYRCGREILRCLSEAMVR